MGAFEISLQPDLAQELERKFFWWEPVGERPRSHARILAQAMDSGSFADIRRLESELGEAFLVSLMMNAEPGWFSDRSWEFWRGRLASAAGKRIPEHAPRRLFDAQRS